MLKICNYVENLGLSVPSVHGEKGDFAIFNMMGSKIGNVQLGFRLLSLGVGLIPHIPDNAVVKFKEKTIESTESKEECKARETADMVLHDIQAIDRPVQVDLFTPGPTIEQIMQTESEQLQTAATQTFKHKSKKKRSRSVDDMFITNTICPPPLFYNSTMEPRKPVKPGLTFTDGVFEADLASSSHFINGAVITNEDDSNEDKYSEYSDSTIRHEDKFSDSDIEDMVDFGNSKITSQKKPLRKTLLKSSPEESRLKLFERATSIQTPNVLGNLAQFPLINALLGEIINLQGINSHKDTVDHIKPKSPRVRSAWEVSRSPTSARRESNREEFLQRLATPRREHERPEGDSGYHKGKRSCASPQKIVPKNKSWLRKETEKRQPEYGVKKTKLAYGMTNTQRLRLAKGNPELLKTLVKKEELRLAERKKSQSAAKNENVVKPFPRVKQQVKGPAEGGSGTKFSLQLESSSRDTMESPKQHKRPVPTPRLSLTGDKKDHKTRDKFNTEKERLIRQMAQLSFNSAEENASSEQSYHTAEPQHSERSQRSIEVYLPSADAPAYESEDATSVEGSDLADPVQYSLGRTKTLAGPGFPRESVDSRQSMVSSYSAQYSDDFEEERQGNSFNESALRKVVEQFSESSAESGQEPSLRKVVEQYSDEGEEPSLRKVVDRYSDDDSLNVDHQYSDHGPSHNSDANSNEKDHSSKSSTPKKVQQSDIKVKNLPMPNPTSSLRSPTPHNNLRASMSTREAMAASTSSIEEEPESDLESSTARIPRSQMPSQSFETGTSLDSTGEAIWKRRRYPRPSPRRSLERIRTESVSSYNPSDPENLSPISPGEPEDVFSETFEENSRSEKDTRHMYVKDLKVPASAKGLGYTWT